MKSPTTKKPARKAPAAKPATASLVASGFVRALVADTISDGLGGYFAIGDVVPTTEDQAASLIANGHAQ